VPLRNVFELMNLLFWLTQWAYAITRCLPLSSISRAGFVIAGVIEPKLLPLGKINSQTKFRKQHHPPTILCTRMDNIWAEYFCAKYYLHSFCNTLEVYGDNQFGPVLWLKFIDFQRVSKCFHAEYYGNHWDAYQGYSCHAAIIETPIKVVPVIRQSSRPVQGCSCHMSIIKTCQGWSCHNLILSYVNHQDSNKGCPCYTAMIETHWPKQERKV
jgi:hypothetical protein